MGSTPNRKRRPATTQEGAENQLISDAFKLAGKQLQEGTASAQVITFFLKLGSTREKLEQEKLHRENLVLSAKLAAIEAGSMTQELVEAAIKAFRSYQGEDVEEEYYDD